MNLTDQKIENEIRLKRIKPEAFIAQFEKFLNGVAETCQVSLHEKWQQRKNRIAYFKPYKKLQNNMDLAKITKKLLRM